MGLDVKLDSADAVFLQWLFKAIGAPKMDNISGQINGKPAIFTWINHKYVVESLPILRQGQESVRKRLAKYVKAGILKTKKVANRENRGSRAYYGLGPTYDAIIWDSGPPVPESRSKDGPPVPESRSKDGPPVPESRSDSLVINDSYVNKDYKGARQKELTAKEKDLVDFAREQFEKMGWMAVNSPDPQREWNALRGLVMFCAQKEKPKAMVLKLLRTFKKLKNMEPFYGKFLFAPSSIWSLRTNLMGQLEAEETQKIVGERPDYKGLI
jgi:hypothetical protein